MLILLLGFFGAFLKWLMGRTGVAFLFSDFGNGWNLGLDLSHTLTCKFQQEFFVLLGRYRLGLENAYFPTVLGKILMGQTCFDKSLENHSKGSLTGFCRKVLH